MAKISKTSKKLQNIQNSKIYDEHKVQERWLDLQALQGSEAPRSLQPAVASKIKQNSTKQSKVELKKQNKPFKAKLSWIKQSWAEQSKTNPNKAKLSWTKQNKAKRDKKQCKARIYTACILGVVFWRWSKAECNLWEREQHRWPCQPCQSKATCCCSLRWSSSPW